MALTLEPSDIILVRMTSDQLRHPHERFNYQNALNGLRNLVRAEGVQGLFRGLGVNTVCSTYPSSGNTAQPAIHTKDEGGLDEREPKLSPMVLCYDNYESRYHRSDREHRSALRSRKRGIHLVYVPLDMTFSSPHS